MLVCRTLTVSGKLSIGVKGIECLECITVFTEVASHLSGNWHLICSQAVQFSGKKIIENVTVRNYWKERLLSILCFGKGSLGKSSILN